MAYYSLQPQAALSIIYFAVSGRSARIRELLLLAGVTLAATVLISAIWPTLGPFAAHGGGDIAYLRDLLALRAGGPWHFELLAMQGIVTMPSYHTVMAVLFTYAFRRTGLVGYGIATLNLVMLLSIPPIGGHYLVDMLAGGALALGAIAVQRAPRHGVSRILFGLRRETLVGKVLNSARGSVFKPERILARALAAKAGRLHDARDGGISAGCVQLTEDKTLHQHRFTAECIGFNHRCPKLASPRAIHYCVMPCAEPARRGSMDQISAKAQAATGRAPQFWQGGVSLSAGVPGASLTFKFLRLTGTCR